MGQFSWIVGRRRQFTDTYKTILDISSVLILSGTYHGFHMISSFLFTTKELDSIRVSVIFIFAGEDTVVLLIKK